MGSGIIFNNGGGGGGASVNPTSTYMPVNIGGSFVDSIFQCIPNTFAQTMRGASGFGFGTTVSGTSSDTWLGDWNNQIDGVYLQVKNDTISSRIFTANRGFYLDYVINRYIFGDWASVYNKTQLVIDDQNELIYTKNNLVNTGLSCDFNIRQYFLGSYGTGNLTYLSIEDSLSTISTKYQTNDIGIKLDFFNNEFTLGDRVTNGNYFFVHAGNSLANITLNTIPWIEVNAVSDYCLLGQSKDQIEIQGSLKTISTRIDNTSIGFKLDQNSYLYQIGDYGGIFNSVNLAVDDLNKEITLGTNGGTVFNNCDSWRFNGAVTTGSSSGNSGQHLQVTINGTPYVIQLLNP